MIRIMVCVGALLAAASAAVAEPFPSRPVMLVVPNPPGGPTDSVARILADGMKTALGQPVVIENITGAGGTVAGAHVAHAAPDGYTIEIGNWSSHVGAAAIYASQYDIRKDLQPIALLSFTPLWIVGRAGLPPDTATDLIAWVKARGTPTSFGIVGSGSGSHLCGVYLQDKIGVPLQFVPYRGAGPIIQDLMGGQIDLSCIDISSSLPMANAGKIKSYAVLSDQRWPKAPSTPTLIEAGIPGSSFLFFQGLWAPAGTPPDIIKKLDGAVQTALADTAVRQRFDALGQSIFPAAAQTPDGLARYHRAEIEKWWPIIKAADIKGE